MAARRGTVGIVREVYNKWERRAPLCPPHVTALVKEGLKVKVQPSTRRVFPDSAYVAAGAELTDDLNDCSLILGVKQIAIDALIPDRTYMFFSHVIKAQESNMPLLDTILDRNIRLMDYECIADNDGRRLIAFGKYAGLAGMIDTLRGVGERLLCKGYSTPFLSMGSAYMYPNLDTAKEAVTNVGRVVADAGLAKGVGPLTFAFTASGNVSQGAQEIFSLLPHEMVSPSDLKYVAEEGDPNLLYGTVIEAEHMAQRKDGAPFDVQDYYLHPHLYDGVFHEQVLPYTSVIVNCMYWDPRFPRLITKDQISEAWAAGSQKLLAVGDLTCDIGGSIEFLVQDTDIEAPFFFWNVDTQAASKSLEGDGVAVLGVDILPSELPVEASFHFGNLLVPFIKSVAESDISKPFAEQGDDVPEEFLRATIAAHGELTPAFQYIEQMRAEKQRGVQEGALAASEEEFEQAEGALSIEITGHLFDTGLINQMLNLIEAQEVDFQIVETLVRPNPKHSERNYSSVVIDLDAKTAEAAADCVEKLNQIVSVFPQAAATVTETDKRAWSSDFRPSRPLTSD